MWYKFSLYPYYLKKEAAMKQTHSNSRRSVYFEGLRDGFPIGLGYFAVSFSLGIAARNAGLTVTQGLLSSLLCNASAGEYALFTLIGSGAACVEIALATLIINARYLLMSCALSQRMSPDMPFYHRFFIGFDVTDELFGITIARPVRGAAVFLRRDDRLHPHVGGGNGARHLHGQPSPGAHRERAERGALRHVPRHHRSPGEGKPRGARLRALGLCRERGVRLSAGTA